MNYIILVLIICSDFMQIDEIKNKHFSYLLEHAKLYLDDDEEIPGELLIHIFGELRVSNLIIPAAEQDDEFIFENVNFEEDNTSYLPLFTNLEEYNKHILVDSEFEPLSNDFELYREIIEESGLDGIIINIEGINITFDNEFISQIPETEPVTFSDEKPAYTKEELKELFETASNGDLVKLMKKRGKDLEEVMVELSNSCMLNPIISDEPLDEFAENGIIKCSDVGGFNLYIIDEEPIRLAMIFTSKGEMLKFIQDTDSNCYGQITVLTELFDFILRNDIDGVVINPATQNYYLLREEIISQARGIELIAEDDRFRDALDYAFTL